MAKRLARKTGQSGFWVRGSERLCDIPAGQRVGGFGDENGRVATLR